MSKVETVHDIAFYVYGLKNADKDTKEKIRSFLNRQLNRTFNGLSWNELSALDKERFIYIIIRDKMLDKYVDDAKKDTIKKRITEHLNASYIEESAYLHAHNMRIASNDTIYYSPNDTDHQMQRAYSLFCQNILTNCPTYNLPSFEQWIIENDASISATGRALSIRDYIYSYEEEKDHNILSNDTLSNPITSAEINDIILQTLLKALNEEFGIEIDVEGIKESLLYVHNFDIDSDDALLEDIDSSLPIPIEQQESIILANKKYLKHKKKLDELSFYTSNID